MQNALAQPAPQESSHNLGLQVTRDSSIRQQKTMDLLEIVMDELQLMNEEAGALPAAPQLISPDSHTFHHIVITSLRLPPI